MVFKVIMLVLVSHSFTSIACTNNAIIILPEAHIKYPLYIHTEIYDSSSKLGKYLRATTDLPKNTTVAKFQGSITKDITNRHAKWIGLDSKGKDIFIVVESSAVYVNHSCEPNCSIDSSDWSIKTMKEVAAYEPLTISYNNKKDFHPDLLWDSNWNFDCYCNAPSCVKRITGWK